MNQYFDNEIEIKENIVIFIYYGDDKHLTRIMSASLILSNHKIFPQIKRTIVGSNFEKNNQNFFFNRLIYSQISNTSSELKVVVLCWLMECATDDECLYNICHRNICVQCIDIQQCAVGDVCSSGSCEKWGFAFLRIGGIVVGSLVGCAILLAILYFSGDFICPFLRKIGKRCCPPPQRKIATEMTSSSKEQMENSIEDLVEVHGAAEEEILWSDFYDKKISQNFYKKKWVNFIFSHSSD